MLLANLMISVFCNTEELNDNPHFIKEIFDLFYPDGFIVSTFQINNIEINLDNQNSPIVKPVERPQLKKSDSNEVINFLPDRIDYTKSIRIAQGEDLEQHQDIDILSFNDGIRYLQKILDHINRKGFRLALNIKYLDKIDGIENTRLINSFYNDKDLSESINKLVTREIFKGETINIIHNNIRSLSPMNVNFGNQNLQFKGNIVQNDINTHQSKLNDRFDGEIIKKYFEYFYELNSKVMDGLNE